MKTMGAVAVVGVTLTREARVALLMARCRYTTLGDRLTRKGRGLLPAWVWRAWNRALCTLVPAHRDAVLTYLTRVRELKKYRNGAMNRGGEAA